MPPSGPPGRRTSRRWRHDNHRSCGTDGGGQADTGGAAGIGLATASLLAERGARVAVLDLDPASLKEPLTGFTADVGDDASVRGAVDAVADAFGGIDLVVNRAGISATGTVEDNADEQWQRVLDVNVVGIVRTTEPPCRTCAGPHTRRWSTSAPSSPRPVCRSALYAASKGAVMSLTLSTAADHVREGIRFNCVNPGTVDTPWVGS